MRKYPDACKDELGRLRVGAAVGVGADLDERAAALVEAGVDLLVVDTAHGHSQGVIDTIAELRKRYPEVQLMAGNIATAAAAQALIDVGGLMRSRLVSVLVQSVPPVLLPVLECHR